MNTDRQQERPRGIPGNVRAQTEADIELPDWNEVRYIDPEFGESVQYRQAGTKKKSFDNGEKFVYRMAPECELTDTGEVSRFPAGRDGNGFLTTGTVWPVNVIEKFGLNRKVSFIPTLPYAPIDGKYPPYSSPTSNPYHLLTTTLWRQKHSSRFPREWRPLVMTTDEIDEYRKQAGLFGSYFSQPLLPLRKWRYFSYGLIFRGYNTVTEEDFEYDGTAYGERPEHGLQLVSVNDQTFQCLQREYARRARSASTGVIDEFYYGDPSAPDQGMLNYVWNRKFPNPVDPNAGKLEGFGYAGAVENRYHTSPSQWQDVDLRLSSSFLDWYAERWRPIVQVLKGITGVEQVRLLARFAPELREPCRRAWQHHPVLMEAWEDAFYGAPVDYDFHETLDMIYGSNEPEQAVGRGPKSDGLPSSPSPRDRDEEPGDGLREALREEMPPRPLSRTLPTVDVPGNTPLTVPGQVHLPGGPISPLNAIGRQFGRQGPAGDEFPDSDDEFPLGEDQ